MADSNRTQLSAAKESVFGTPPGGNYKEIPILSHTLRPNTDKQFSNVIRSDGQRLEPQQLDIGAEGDVPTEVMYGTVDDFLASALRHSTTWAASVPIISASVNVDIDASTGIVTLGTGTWTNTPTVGRWVRIRGASNAGNNSAFKVSAATTTTFTVANKEGMVTEAAGASMTILHGEQITNGTQLDSYTLEGKHPELAVPLFPRWVGMVLNRMRLNIANGSFQTLNFGFIGKREISPIPTSADGTLVPYTAKPSMQAVNHVPKIQFDNVGVELVDVSLEVNNSVQGRRVIGALGATSMRAGSFELTGSLKAYFQTADLANAFLADTPGALAVVLKDSDVGNDGNIYVLDVPALKLSSAVRDVPGLNTDVMLDLGLMAYRHATENVTMRIVRFPGV